MTSGKLRFLRLLLYHEVSIFFQALKHHISDLKEMIELLKSELV